MQAADATSEKPQGRDDRLVLRNTMYLGIAEVVSMPMSILLNAVMARYLGPADLGHIYLATTVAGLAFLLISWGHNGSLPAAVIADKSAAGALLGSSLAWRVVASAAGYGLVVLGCHALGQSAEQQWAIGLVFLGYAITTLLAACQDAIRGFERTDIAAYSRVGLQFLSTVLVVAALLAGGRMKMALLASAVADLLILFPVLRVLRSVGIGKLGWDAQRLKQLMVHGTPFAVFALALVLQPNVDAFYLAELTTPEVVGWYSVSRRLLGVLVVPATALIGALYPTLVRLFVTDRDGFLSTTRNSIATVSLIVMPGVLGCLLYPEIGVAIFGRESYRPTEDVLRYSSPYLFLIYFSMPIGCALVAGGRQKIWTAVQLLSVVSNGILDPFLIEYYQRSTGNGGVGLTIASAAAELFLVVVGIVLLPRGVFDRRLAKTLALALLSGFAMGAVAYVLRGIPGLLAAPIAVTAYGLSLYLTGAVSPEQMAALTGFVQRKLKRKQSAP